MSGRNVVSLMFPEWGHERNFKSIRRLSYRKERQRALFPVLRLAPALQELSFRSSHWTALSASISAIYHQMCCGNKAGLVGRQEQSRIGNLFRIAQPI